LPRERLIEVRNLNGGWGRQQVLAGLSMEVHEGEIIVVVGKSGCGKSTLMRYLLGLSEPWSGTVTYDGRNIWSSPRVLERARRRWGVLFQSGALLGSFTLLENVSLPLVEFTGLSEDEVEMVAMHKLDIVGLADAAGSLPLSVSGGMQKRAALARAMALDPEVLFFDEPSAGLDPVTSYSLDLLIRKINREMGTTMVIVTHELASIFAISDRVVMLDADAMGIIATGTAEELRDSSDDPRVQRFFSPTEEEGA